MAVYTRITESDLRAFLRHYDLGELVSYEGIAQGVSNSNYHLFTDKGRYILTLFEEFRTDVANLPFYFAYSQHLGGNGIHCPQPYPDRQGALYGRLCGKAAAILSFLPGRVVEPDEIAPQMCRELGELVAKMHLAAAGFTPTRLNSMGLAAWKKLAETTGVRADEIEGGLAAFVAGELAWLSAMWPEEGDLPRAAVHADIFPDNVFLKDGHVDAVIDFYFSCTDFLAFDLAIVINAWCFDTDWQFQSGRFSALLDGYQKIRLLSEREWRAMPVILRGAAMRILSTRTHDLVFHDPESVVTPHDPREYLAKLEFHQNENIFDY